MSAREDESFETHSKLDLDLARSDRRRFRVIKIPAELQVFLYGENSCTCNNDRSRCTLRWRGLGRNTRPRPLFSRPETQAKRGALGACLIEAKGLSEPTGSVAVQVKLCSRGNLSPLARLHATAASSWRAARCSRVRRLRDRPVATSIRGVFYRQQIRGECEREIDKHECRGGRARAKKKKKKLS